MRQKLEHGDDFQGEGPGGGCFWDWTSDESSSSYHGANYEKKHGHLKLDMLILGSNLKLFRALNLFFPAVDFC